MSDYGYGDKTLVLCGYVKRRLLFGAVIGEFKIRPGKLVKVDNYGSDFPGEVGNASLNRISLVGCKAYACLIASDGDAGFIGVICGKSHGNGNESGTKLGCGRVVNEATEGVVNVPLKSRNVNRKNARVNFPINEVGNASLHNVVTVNSGEGRGSGVLSNLGSGYGAAVGEGYALGRIGAVLKSDGMSRAVELDGSGVIPLRPAYVNRLRSDGPILRHSDNRGVNLAVSGVKAVKIIDTDNFCGVAARLGILIAFVNKLYVIDAVRINAVLGAIVIKLGGSGPNDVGGGDYLFGDVNGYNVGGYGFGDNTLCNGNDAVVFTAVRDADNLEGIGGSKRDIAVCINPVPLIGIACTDGIADNLYKRGGAVVFLFNVGTYGKGKVLVNNGGKDGVAVGHFGNGISVFINPCNDSLSVKLGNGRKELYVLVLNARGEEALSDNVSVKVGVLYSLDFLKGNVKVNRCANHLFVDEGGNERSVLFGNLRELLLDIDGIRALVTEHAVTLVKVHKGEICKAVGHRNAVKNAN